MIGFQKYKQILSQKKNGAHINLLNEEEEIKLNHKNELIVSY